MKPRIVSRPTLVASICVIGFTAYSVIPVFQGISEQKAVGGGYPGDLLVALFVFLVQAAILFVVVRLLVSRLSRKNAPPTNLTHYR